MNCCFYEAISKLPLGTVAAIEFLPVVALAAIGARTPRNYAALALAVAGVYELSHVQLTAEPPDSRSPSPTPPCSPRTSCSPIARPREPAIKGIDGLAAAMLIAAVVVTPVAGSGGAAALGDPIALLAGVGVGICSSVIPYVTDQLAMAELSRSTYSLMVSLLPAIATLVGVVVLTQLPSAGELVGVGLVIAGVAMHRDLDQDARSRHATSSEEYRRA